MKNIVLFGPPGAGKGTQSALLVSQCGYFQISTGDLLRTAIKNKSDLGQKAKSYMDKGALVPDDLVIALVDEVLGSLGGKNFILDGFPRTRPQAEALEEILRSRKIKIDKAIFLEVSHEELVSRLTGRRVCSNCGAVFHIQTQRPKQEGYCDKCGSALTQRSDDKEDVIIERLRTYALSTAPLRDYYKKCGNYTEVSGENEADAVFLKLKELIKN